MSQTFLYFLAFAFSLAMWVSSTHTNALSGVARAGLLGPRSFVKVSVPAVLLVALACMFAKVELSRLDYFLVMATVASLTNGLYVVILAGLYGLDSEMADAMRDIESAKKNDLKLGEWSDPKRLQAYLDKTYGRGKLNAKLILAEMKSAS